MGQSTDGIVFYGYWFSDDHEDNEHLEEVALEQSSNARVQIGTHCSDDYPMYYVYVGASQVTAWRGYPQPLDQERINESRIASWDLELQQFAIEHGLTAPGTVAGEKDWDDKTSEVGWWLVSYWG